MKKFALAMAMAALAVLNAQAGTHAKVQLWEGGPYWATTNIGADNPEDYGLYFWWGDTTGHRPSSDGTFSFNFDWVNSAIYANRMNIATLQSEGWIVSRDGTYVLTPMHDAAHVQWGGGWRIPTYSDLSALNSNCDWTWTSQNGVNGYIVRGRGAYASNSIFLPCAGYGSGTSLGGAGSSGWYWSSVTYSDGQSWDFLFDSSHHGTSFSHRIYGRSIRPVQGFGEVNYINLNASQNYDDRIQLTWNVGSELMGTRYFVDRRERETDPFRCINENEPTRDRRYDDKTASAGVNYYYRVRSESGVESEQVVGKRVAKTVEPEFQFTLEGTDRPEERGVKGLNDETDVLVAGHVFYCNVSVVEPTQNVTIKKIELIGRNVGGAASKKDHKILWFSDDVAVKPSAELLFTYDAWDSFSAQSCPVLSAKLRAGRGCHGIYSWTVKCEYEMDGGIYKSETPLNKAVKKNVYFAKYEDSKVPAQKDFDGKKHCEYAPNWFAYWGEDGACPGLNDDKVFFAGKRIDGSLCGGVSNSGESRDSNRRVCLNWDAAGHWGPSVTRRLFGKEPITIHGKTFHTWDGGREVHGIYKVEDTIAHEWQHHETAKRYNAQEGKKDSDKQEGQCLIKTETDGVSVVECKTVTKKRKMCDSIVDEDEINDYFGLKDFFKVSSQVTSETNLDTYALAKIKSWTYGAYGDNELVSLVAGRNGMEKAKWQKDWAYPGEQAGGIPLEASPSYRGTRMLSVTPKSSPKLQSSEPQSSTNLIISINSITAESQRDQNSVTSLVYTIGVSIQGDELVEFNGYLYDAQSNTVATAISAASAESDSVELFFDARDIFDNYNGGPLTLGRVDLTIDGYYSTNNVLGVLYDFAVDPIEVDKDELLCNKGYIIDTVINEQSETGVVATVSTKINVADGYLVSAELVSTNDELVAFASVSNLCVVGTNTFRLAFSSDAIYQNGIGGICAVKNVKLWQNDELVDADATGAELPSVYACSDFVPSNACVAVDLESGRFIAPSMATDGKLSSLRFVFDVTNGTDTAIGYDVAAMLTGTNSALAASISTIAYVTSGVNQIELSSPASDIAASGVDGPYRFESIELRPQGDSTCGTTYRPTVLSESYVASDFGASAIKPCGKPRLVGTLAGDRVAVEYSYEAVRVGHVIAEVVLADRNGDFAARIVTTNDVLEVGVKTNIISVSRNDVANAGDDSPYAVASLSVVPDIVGESPVYMDTESLTNIFWQVAAPVFAPVTKTVFFNRSQPVAISCATPEAEIRYTLDGSEPTDASTLYEGSFTISSNMIVKAKAFAEGMRPSETAVAEYVRAALVGDNLVQDTSPGHGAAQPLNVPVPGTYQVSFDYAQGGAVELRLLQDGTVRTLAAVSAESAGSTNFLFDVSAAGAYELVVHDLSSGTLQPAEVSNLNVSIPDTPENRQRFWIYETESTYCSTGEWITEEGFKNGKMHVAATNSSVFSPYVRSDGRFVTIVSEIEFLFPFRHKTQSTCEGKAAIGIGKTEDGGLTFIIWTKEDGVRTWKPVGAQGLAAPALNTPYTIRFMLDYTNKTYSASILEQGDEETVLSDGTTNAFAFADEADTIVEHLEFLGPGNLMSLSGKYQNPQSEFKCGDTIPIAGGNVPITLTGGQATWLNSMNAYDSVMAKIAAMGQGDFNDAYLLNLDISQSEFGLGKFKVTGIDVTESEVRISVVLNRTGAVQVSRGDGSRDAPINGILKLYGGESPSGKTLLNATILTDANFGSGNTEVFVYPRSGSAKFFRPAIVSP